MCLYSLTLLFVRMRAYLFVTLDARKFIIHSFHGALACIIVFDLI